jgi:transcriptional antiterminator
MRRTRKMIEAWVKFLFNVSDRELIRYITSWEQALTWYGIETYSYNSNARALAGAYEVLDIRAREREKGI